MKYQKSLADTNKISCTQTIMDKLTSGLVWPSLQAPSP